MITPHGVYVGNLPADLSESTLISYFSICGQIISANVINYYENNDKRAYGFVYFTNSADQEKALLFNGKQLGILVIKVLRAKGVCFKTFVDGIPRDKRKEQITSVLDYYFRGKYSPAFCYNQSEGTLMVAFHDDESRHQYIQKRGIISDRQAVIQEPTKMLNYAQIQENTSFDVYLRNIPYGTTRHTIEQMFLLCGPILSAKVSYSENTFITGQVTFTTQKGFATALKFNNSNVHEWELPIIVTTEKFIPSNIWKKEYRFAATIQCYDPELKLWEIEKKICKTIGNVYIIRSKRPPNSGAQPFLYANFKTKEERDELLTLKSTNLGGSGPACFALHGANNGNLTRFSSMESVNSISSGVYNMRTNSPQSPPYQAANLPSPLFQTQPATFKNKCTLIVSSKRKIDAYTLRQLFNQMVIIKNITKVGESYSIEIEI